MKMKKINSKEKENKIENKYRGELCCFKKSNNEKQCPQA